MSNGYADDLQYVIAGVDDDVLIERCNSILERWIHICNIKSLCINQEKNHTTETHYKTKTTNKASRHYTPELQG